MKTVAALFVEGGGPYNLPFVDVWDVTRDARKYPGPLPVVAHPPCERWGRYATGGPNPKAKRRQVGDDGGCFESALESVRSFGGVLEHPAASKAWDIFGLNRPQYGKWVKADIWGGWTTQVDQGTYGHPARKATWLYYIGTVPPPVLNWNRVSNLLRLEPGFHSKEEAKKVRGSDWYVPIKRLSTKERIHTPVQFRDLLLQIALASTSGPMLYVGI